VNVLFIIDTLEIGGAEKSLLEITSRFTQFTPVFITLYKGDTLKPAYEGKGIKVVSLNLPSDYNFSKNPDQVVNVISRYNPVILHATLFRANMIARELRSTLNIPVINSIVSSSYSLKRYKTFSLTRALKHVAVQLQDMFSARNVDLFISNSAAAAKSTSDALFIDKKKIKVIYRGRDPKAFMVGEDQIEHIRTEFRTIGKKVFLTVGRLLAFKGQGDLIKAFLRIREKQSNVLLLIAGEGNDRPYLENLIRQSGLEKDVLLLGNRNDVPALLSAADFFVFPSHNEGLPGALIEAMFAKTPIIASDIPENLECVDSSMALIYPKGDVDQLAILLEKALSAGDWQLKCQRAYDKAMKHFEIQAIADQYEFMYKELLASTQTSQYP
jgi:glycosyltransferase involved in cell wall biosynthesis